MLYSQSPQTRKSCWLVYGFHSPADLVVFRPIIIGSLLYNRIPITPELYVQFLPEGIIIIVLQDVAELVNSVVLGTPLCGDMK